MAASTMNTSSQSGVGRGKNKRKHKSNVNGSSSLISKIESKGKWKVADVNYSALMLDELRQFGGIEELEVAHEVLSAHDIHHSESLGSGRKTRRGKRRMKAQTASSTEFNQLKRKTAPPSDQPGFISKRIKNQPTQQNPQNPNVRQGARKIDVQRRSKDKKLRKSKTDKKSKSSSFTKGIPLPTTEEKLNMSAWKTLNIPAPVLKALEDLGYQEPTPIQKATIPGAIKEGQDVVGAAETGSGKTLAFGIPVLHNILQYKAAKGRIARAAAFKEATIKASPGRETPTEGGKGATVSFKGASISAKGAAAPSKETSTSRKDSKKPMAKAETRDKTQNRVGRIDVEMEDVEMEDFEVRQGDDDDDAVSSCDEDERLTGEARNEEDSEDDDIDYDFSDGDEDDDDDEQDEEDEEDDDSEDELARSDDDDKEENEVGKEQSVENAAQSLPDPPSPEKPSDPKKKKKPWQKKRKFRIRERKMLELDGETFEGVELFHKKDKYGIGCVRAIDDVSTGEMLAKIGDDGVTVVEEEQRRGTEAGFPPSEDARQLLALILMPTRELAVQVKNHLAAAAKYTDIKIAVIVGGMSTQKQQRLLRRKPEIVVGTPGRIWDLYREGEPHLATMSEIRCLVLDEADRMIEKGHYAELTEILRQLNSSQSCLERQTFIFSATLTLVHLGSDRKVVAKQFKKKATPKQQKREKKEKLHFLMKKIGIGEDPLMVDLTQKVGTVASLMEAKIICDVTDKDVYLYYFLLQFPGRTLVFANSIDCIRRLCSILTLLGYGPLPLHSNMHQKQRLKNLDRFAANPKGLVLATDVAARGLDIPDVQHVIHYQVPRTSEMYIHRSGRTARQAKEGISILLVASKEAHFYRRVCKTLDRDDIPNFPVNHGYLQAVRTRVELARLIDKTAHGLERKKQSNDWFVKAAKDLDIDLDEDLVLHDLGDSHEQVQRSRDLQQMKAEMSSLLKQTIFSRGSSWVYPTITGKLVGPLTTSDSSAVAVARSHTGDQGKGSLQQAEPVPSKRAKRSRNKFKQRGQDEDPQPV